MLFLKRDENMYRLLEILFYNDRKWLEIDTLSDKLTLSKKTVLNYLDSLEKMFEDYASFDKTSTLIRANFIFDIGIKSIKKIFIRNTLISQIIYYSFFHQDISKKDLGKILGTSDSSIYRNIESFNEAIKDCYKIEFSYKDLEFIGDELEIQKFYLNLLINTQTDMTAWPFTAYILENDATRITELICANVKRDFIYSQISFIKAALAISVVRYKSGHKNKIESYDPIIMNLIKKSMDCEEAREICHRVFPNYKGDYPKLIYQILAFFFKKEFMPFFNNLDEIFEKAPIYVTYYEYMYSKITYMCEKYDIPKNDISYIYKEIFSYFYVKLFNVSGNDFFISKSDRFLDYIKLINIDFYRDLREIMKEFLESFPELKKRYSLNDLMYSVYNTWPGLITHLIKSQKPLKALLIAGFDRAPASVVQDFINSTSSLLVKADIYKKSRLDIDYLKNSDYDLILVDFIFTEDLGDKVVINLENFPMATRTYNILNKVLSKKITNIKANNPDLFDDDPTSFPF